MDVASFKGMAETRASIRKPLKYAVLRILLTFHPVNSNQGVLFPLVISKSPPFEMEMIGIMAMEFLI